MTKKVVPRGAPLFYIKNFKFTLPNVLKCIEVHKNLKNKILKNIKFSKKLPMTCTSKNFKFPYVHIVKI